MIHLLFVIAVVLFVIWLFLHAGAVLWNLIWIAIIVALVLWLLGFLTGPRRRGTWW